MKVLNIHSQQGGTFNVGDVAEVRVMYSTDEQHNSKECRIERPRGGAPTLHRHDDIHAPVTVVWE